MIRSNTLTQGGDSLSSGITKLIDDFTENSITSPKEDWARRKDDNLLLRSLLVGMAIASPSQSSYFIDHRNNKSSHFRQNEEDESYEIKRIYNKILNEISHNEEIFDDGKVSRLAHDMLLLYIEDKGATVEALNLVIKGLRKKDQPKAAEILKWLGYLTASNNDLALIWVLLNASKSSSLYIRDAAALALVDYAPMVQAQLFEQLIDNESIDYIKDTLEYAYKRSLDAETDSQNK